MRVELAGETRTGHVVDLRDFDIFAGIDASSVVDAIRNDGQHDCPLTIDCPTPGLVHEYVGVIRAETDLSLRPSLAAAARTRGHTPPQADDLAAVRDRLDALDPPEIDLQEARRRVAETSDIADETREEVAALRGRVQALRDTEDDHEAAEAELSEATRKLSKVETERIAAEQALARARDRATENRERRRERLRLEDRAANLRRASREHLAGVVRESFEEARADVPAGVGPSVSTAFAVARVAKLEAPVVVASGADSFEGVEELSRWLKSSIVVL